MWNVVVLAALFVPGPQATADARPSSRRHRRRVAVTVVDRTGSSVPEAEVRFIGRPIPGVDLGQLDEVRVRCDQRGRARAGLLPDRSYSAWAQWLDSKKHPRQSAILDGVGRTARFVEASKSAPRQQLTLRGLVAWNRFAPLGARVRLPTRTFFTIPMPIGTDGKAEIPPIPLGAAARFGAEFLGARQPLAGTWTSAMRRRTFPLPPPTLERLTVSDQAGRPIAGVQIWVRSGPSEWSSWGLRGKTDATGHGVAALATATLLGSINFEVRLRKPGYQDTGFALRWGTALLGHERLESKPAVWPIVLRSEKPMTGAILGIAGKPLRNATIVVASDTYHRASARTWVSRYAGYEVHHTSPSGQIVVRGMPVGQKRVGLTLLLPRAQRDLLEARLAGWPAPAAALPLRLRRDREADAGFGDLDLRTWHLIRVRVVGPDGMPIRAAAIRAFRGSWLARVSQLGTTSPPTDLRGRVTLFKPRTAVHFASWDLERGYAFHDIPKGVEEPIDVSLRPFAIASGRCVDQANHPVVGAELRRKGWDQTGGDQYAPLARSISLRLSHVRTDADGRFRLRFVPAKGRIDRFQFVKNGRKSASFEVSSEPNTDIEVTLQ